MSNAEGLPARAGGAKALLLTVLGEFVLPAGGAAWTSTFVAVANQLGVGEKNARQALSRISDQGFIERSRHGRSVRWALTTAGRELLETGTERIYQFGSREIDWNGRWLVAHCPVPEPQRTLRNELRRELAFLGFGELSPSLLVSPHVGHDVRLRAVIRRLGLERESTIMWSETVDGLDDIALVSKAWNLDDLGDSYRSFSVSHRNVEAPTAHEAFRALVALVHDWRRFPFADPELPTQLLPSSWAGTTAATLFHERHSLLSPEAQRWFSELEQVEAAV